MLHRLREGGRRRERYISWYAITKCCIDLPIRGGREGGRDIYAVCVYMCVGIQIINSYCYPSWVVNVNCFSIYIRNSIPSITVQSTMFHPFHWVGNIRFLLTKQLDCEQKPSEIPPAIWKLVSKQADMCAWSIECQRTLWRMGILWVGLDEVLTNCVCVRVCVCMDGCGCVIIFYKYSLRMKKHCKMSSIYLRNGANGADF